ncbi:hypothetical protein ACXYMU_16395 [Pontibacter sp. CAU 1760]
MKKDIDFGTVEGVSIAVATSTNDIGEAQWDVYLLNNNAFAIDNVLVASKGYGTLNDEEVKTSVLRHMFERVEAKSFVQVEPIDPALFSINNEYWVSYYIDKQIFDKKFVFVPDTIKEENLVAISMLQLQGVLHT